MYRRRRPQRELISFSFDSFLDVVANLIGVIIRLILVAWVGARSYHSAMALMVNEPASQARKLSAPQATDDPLNPQIAQARKELDAIQARLQEQMRQLHAFETDREVQRQVMGQLTNQRHELVQASKRLDEALAGKTIDGPPPELDELRQRGQELTKAIKTLENAPVKKQVLRYQVPVSRVVEGEELCFECRAGRVTFIDLPAFTREMEMRKEELDRVLKNEWTTEATTSSSGAFRLRFTRERLPEAGESPTGKSRSPFFRSGYTGWELEPLSPQRGETGEEALKAGSAFRQAVDGLDPTLGVVTLWVYPDSFELYRRLRDYMQVHEIEVAGRPLPLGHAIRASKYGSKSRGQ